MKMFRGLGQDYVARRLVLRGWPEPAAARMAEFMCGGHQIPRWEELVGSAQDGYREPDLDYLEEVNSRWQEFVGGEMIKLPYTSVDPEQNPLLSLAKRWTTAQREVLRISATLNALGDTSLWTQEGYQVEIGYTNHRGEFAVRTITPKRFWYGSTEWHPEPQWLLNAFDHDKAVYRDFALSGFGEKL